MAVREEEEVVVVVQILCQVGSGKGMYAMLCIYEM